jgi:hypothetical protein
MSGAELAVIDNSRYGGKLKGLDPKDILDRYLAGETSPQIAESFGVTKQALSLWLISKGETDWKAAQLVKAIDRKDRADELLETASNMLDLTRGQAMLKSAQWDLERVCRRIYGQDVAQVAQAVQININLRRENSSHDEVARLRTVGSTDESST